MLSTWPGPLEQYTTNLGLLPTTYAPNVRQKVVSEALRPTDGKVDIVELKITIERHKVVFIAALQNDAKYITLKNLNCMTYSY
jgi:hypothetical protein